MRKLLFLLGLIAFLILAIYCIYGHKDKIQQTIQARATQTISNITDGNVSASTNGRDVTLTGNVDSQQSKKQIGQDVASQLGVRTVNNNLTVTPVQADLVPTLPPMSNETDLSMDLMDEPPTMNEPTEAPAFEEPAVAAPSAEILMANNKCQEDLKEVMEGKTIKFDTGKSTVSTSSIALIKQLATISNNCPSAQAIVVHGHTDNVGNAKSNMDLSVKRAVSVGQQLKKYGVKQRVDGVGHGDQSPIADNKTAAGRAQNRRIEFKVK